MRITKYKLFFAWDYEKEEKWINQMSQKGLQLEKVGFLKYIFNEEEQGKYIYRLQFLDNLPMVKGSQDYINFVEDSGAEYVDNYFRWVYFRRNSELGEFKLFSDVESKIKHLYTLFKLFVTLFCMDFIIAITNMIHLFRSNEIGSGNLMEISRIVVIASALLMGYASIRIGATLRNLKKEKLLHD